QALALGAAAGAASLAGLTPAQAQALTSLEMFIPAAPGGGWDQTGRSIESVMRAENLVQNFQFEHAPGAGGAVGLPKFLGSKRGKENAVMVGGMVMVGSLIANKSPVKMTDLTPLARLTGEALALVVPATSPFKNLADLVTALKADPGKVSIAGGSAGGSDHILAGMLAKASGVEAKRVAYVAFAGGGPAQAAILGAQVAAGISGYGEFAEQVKAGKMRAIAISSDKRLPGIDVPTFKEQGVDVELFNWRGVFGAPGITPAQRAALIGLFDKLVATPGWTAELQKRDWTGVYLSGDAYGSFLTAEIDRITGILKDLGLSS
ncbi:MAG: Bug family tripartite tricarboxylate transporter substrate binding protein, partial [Beijerinckiaceae bacterium]